MSKKVVGKNAAGAVTDFTPGGHMDGKYHGARPVLSPSHVAVTRSSADSRREILSPSVQKLRVCLDVCCVPCSRS